MVESFRIRLVVFLSSDLLQHSSLYTQSRSSYLAAIPAVLSFLVVVKKKQWIPPVLLLVGLLLPFMAPKSPRTRVVHLYQALVVRTWSPLQAYSWTRPLPQESRAGRQRSETYRNTLCWDSVSRDTALWTPSMSGSPRDRIGGATHFSHFAGDHPQTLLPGLQHEP